MKQLLHKFRDQNGLHSREGRRGVINLIKVLRAIGYKDPMYYGQLDQHAAIGDLICFLEDNPGAIDALLDWIADNGKGSDWERELRSAVDDEEDDVELDDNEDY